MDEFDQIVSIPLGEQRRIALPGRGSGGFSWTIDQTGDSGTVSVRREAGERPKLPPAGGPPPSSFSLDEVLVVTGLKPGTVVLDGRLGRPAASGEAPIDHRRIRVDVTPPPARPPAP